MSYECKKLKHLYYLFYIHIINLPKYSKMNDDNGYGFYCDLDVSPQQLVFSKNTNKNKPMNPSCFNHYLKPFNDPDYYFDDSYLYEEATVIHMKKFDENDKNIQNYLNVKKNYVSNVYFNLTCIATMCISAVFIFKKI
jgi:hypothetical protein